MNFKKKISIPITPFNNWLALYILFILANIAFSSSPATSLLTAFPFSFSSIKSNFLNSFFSPALPIAESWQMIISSFAASIKNTFLGIGIGNFDNTLSLFRPTSLNSKDFWFWNFTHSESPALTLLSEQGLLGFFFWLFFFYQSYKTFRAYMTHDQEFHFSNKKRFIIKSYFSLVFISFAIFICDISTIILPTSNFKIQISNLVFPISFFSMLIISIMLSRKQIPGFKAKSFSTAIMSTIIFCILIITIIFSIFSSEINPLFWQQKAILQIEKAENLAKKKNPNSVEIKNLVVSALNNSRKSISLNPNNSALQRNYLQILIKSTNLVSNSEKITFEKFQDLINSNKNNPMNHYMFGLYSYKINNIPMSKEELIKTIKLKPDYAPAWFALHEAYTASAQNAKMIGNLELEEYETKQSENAKQEAKHLYCEVQGNFEECKRIK